MAHREGRRPLEWLGQYGGAALATGATVAAVGLIKASEPSLEVAFLLYLVPIILAASRWGLGPALVAVAISMLGHNVLFIGPAGGLGIPDANEAIGLVILLLSALVTSQLADSARRGALGEQEAAVARRSDELKTALLRTVSHELRTPLASIKASVSSLRQPGAALTREDRAELLAEIEEEADHLDRLVGNLLDASRLEAGVLHPHKRPQDIGELVGAVLARLEPMLDGHPVRVDIPESLPLVPCEYLQIDHVVSNLVENAAVHTPPGTAITIRAALDGLRMRVEVQDQGPGLPGWDRERLFRPFERGPTAAHGSGLGLTIARGFVEAHGGHLWAEDAPGGGARFVFTLPLEEGQIEEGQT